MVEKLTGRYSARATDPISHRTRATWLVVLGVAALVGFVACSISAVQAAVPVDMYGRPLADELGPIEYRQDGDLWIAVHADGSTEPAPPAVSESPTEPSQPLTGFHFDPYLTYTTGSHPTAVAIGDVTGDGRPDVVLTTGHDLSHPANDHLVFVFAQRPDGGLGAPYMYTYAVPSDRNGLALADLDEDGVRDVVVGHATGITVLLTSAQGGFGTAIVTTDADADNVVTMDVDRDGHVDVISLGWQRGATIFYGDGHGGFRQSEHLDTYAKGFNDLDTEDLTGDGIDDLVVATGNAGPYLTVHRHDGVNGFAGANTYGMPDNLLRGVGLGDISGDGLNDAVLSRPTNSPCWLWIMTQDPSTHLLTGPTTISTFQIPEALKVADLDNDGREDAVVLHAGWIRLGTYLQAPGGGLGPEVLYPIPYASYYSGHSLAVGDFSSDGCPDVAIASYPTGLTVLHGSGCIPLCVPDGCDDQNACTNDSCNPATGCVHTNNIAPCNDGNACTTGDFCGGGACHSGLPVVCNDDNACTTDSCDPALGCVHTNNAAPCDDGNACTTGDTCGNGVCRPGDPTNCDDGACCTIDSCNPATGCQHTANTGAPVFTIQPSLGNCAVLWPPNHGYVDFSVADTHAEAASQCGVDSIRFASCSSSQSENARGTGDGNTLRDCVYEPSTMHLRAERNGACSPIGRVYEATLIAIDACGNAAVSAPFGVSVWHDREHAPVGAQVYHPVGGSDDTRNGATGTYNPVSDACGAGSDCANGTTQDHSDADPEMEIDQNAALSVQDLRADKSYGGDLTLTWTEPLPRPPIVVTRYHIYRQDPDTLDWTLIAEVPEHILSFTDPSIHDGTNWYYKVTALIK